MAADFGARVVRARETVEPILLHAREARLLGNPPRSLALQVEGIAYAEDGSPVEAARSFVRSDRSRYFLERAVTRDSWEDESDPPLVAAAGLVSRSAHGEPVQGGEEAGRRRHA